MIAFNIAHVLARLPRARRPRPHVRSARAARLLHLPFATSAPDRRRVRGRARGLLRGERPAARALRCAASRSRCRAPAMTLAQMALSALDWTLAAGVLFVLLPATPGLGFPTLLGIFLLAQVAGSRATCRAGSASSRPRSCCSRPVAPGRRRARLRARLPRRLLPDPARARARALRRASRRSQRRTALRARGRLARAVAARTSCRARSRSRRSPAGAMLLVSVATPAHRFAHGVARALCCRCRARALALPRAARSASASCCSRARCSSASTRRRG